MEQQMTREQILRALMTANPNQMVEWKGERITVAQMLYDIMQGEGAIVHLPQPPKDDPQGGSGSSGAYVEPSREAIEALGQAKYDELQRTGSLEGFNAPIKPRVHVRSSRPYSASFARNPETGKVEKVDPTEWGKFYYQTPRFNHETGKMEGGTYNPETGKAE